MSTLNTQLHQELGRLVQERRKALGMSQEALSDAMNLSRSSIANIERGRQKLSVETLYDLAQALRTDPAQLLPPATSKPKKPASIRKLLPQASESEKEFIHSILIQKGTSHDSKGELGEAKAPGGPDPQNS